MLIISSNPYSIIHGYGSSLGAGPRALGLASTLSRTAAEKSLEVAGLEAMPALGDSLVEGAAVLADGVARGRRGLGRLAFEVVAVLALGLESGLLCQTAFTSSLGPRRGRKLEEEEEGSG